MNSKTDTCWYREKCHEEMIAGATGKLWPVLEESGHWPVLKELIEAVDIIEYWPWLLDIGCGAGSLGQTKIVKKHFNYIGADLGEVIHNVALKVNPDEPYLQVDMLQSELKFISMYGDVVVMNAFIDVMEKPLDMLHNIIDKCKNYVIIHRQFVIPGPTMIKKASSYGGYTFISHINEIEFNNAIKHFKIVKKLETGLGKNNYSYLLKRFKT